MPKMFNAVEPIVSKVFINDFMKNTSLSCTCERCQLDIMAIALNHLPPHYVVTTEGELYVKALYYNQQLTLDILTQLSKAALIVQQKPNHPHGVT